MRCRDRQRARRSTRAVPTAPIARPADGERGRAEGSKRRQLLGGRCVAAPLLHSGRTVPAWRSRRREARRQRQGVKSQVGAALCHARPRCSSCREHVSRNVGGGVRPPCVPPTHSAATPSQLRHCGRATERPSCLRRSWCAHRCRRTQRQGLPQSNQAGSCWRATGACCRARSRAA